MSEALLKGLSDDQIAAFKELRTKINEEFPDESYCDDRCLVRYLRFLV